MIPRRAFGAASERGPFGARARPRPPVSARRRFLELGRPEPAEQVVSAVDGNRRHCQSGTASGAGGCSIATGGLGAMLESRCPPRAAAPPCGGTPPRRAVPPAGGRSARGCRQQGCPAAPARRGRPNRHSAAAAAHTSFGMYFWAPATHSVEMRGHKGQREPLSRLTVATAGPTPTQICWVTVDE